MGTLVRSFLHRFKKNAINVNRRSKGSLERNVNLEISEKISNHQSKGRSLLGISRFSDSINLIISLRMLTLMPFRRK